MDFILTRKPFPIVVSTYRVLSRVNRILDEKTGRLVEFKNEAIILEGVFCQARYSACRMFCPRAIYTYWREIWLERVSESYPGQEKSCPTGRRLPSPLNSPA